jgi:hypothetical protein
VEYTMEKGMEVGAGPQQRCVYAHDTFS